MATPAAPAHPLWTRLARGLDLALLPVMAALIAGHTLLSWRIGGLRVLRRMVA